MGGRRPRQTCAGPGARSGRFADPVRRGVLRLPGRPCVTPAMPPSRRSAARFATPSPPRRRGERRAPRLLAALGGEGRRGHRGRAPLPAACGAAPFYMDRGPGAPCVCLRGLSLRARGAGRAVRVPACGRLGRQECIGGRQPRPVRVATPAREMPGRQALSLTGRPTQVCAWLGEDVWLRASLIVARCSFGAVEDSGARTTAVRRRSRPAAHPTAAGREMVYGAPPNHGALPESPGRGSRTPAVRAHSSSPQPVAVGSGAGPPG